MTINQLERLADLYFVYVLEGYREFTDFNLEDNADIVDVFKGYVSEYSKHVHPETLRVMTEYAPDRRDLYIIDAVGKAFLEDCAPKSVSYEFQHMRAMERVKERFSEKV